MRNAKSKTKNKCRGLTLIEALLFLMILSIVAAATGLALQALVHVPDTNDNISTTQAKLIDKMETLRSTAFASLTVGSYSDTVTIQNLNNVTRSWTIALQDPTGGSSTVSDFKKLTVTINGQTLTCWVSALQ